MKERDYMEDLGVNGRIISRGIVKELKGRAQTGLLAEDREVTGCCEHCNEPSGSTKLWECLD